MMGMMIRAMPKVVVGIKSLCEIVQPPLGQPTNVRFSPPYTGPGFFLQMRQVREYSWMEVPTDLRPRWRMLLQGLGWGQGETCCIVGILTWDHLCHPQSSVNHPTPPYCTALYSLKSICLFPVYLFSQQFCRMSRIGVVTLNFTNKETDALAM